MFCHVLQLFQNDSRSSTVGFQELNLNGFLTLADAAQNEICICVHPKLLDGVQVRVLQASEDLPKEARKSSLVLPAVSVGTQEGQIPVSDRKY